MNKVSVVGGLFRLPQIGRVYPRRTVLPEVKIFTLSEQRKTDTAGIIGDRPLRYSDVELAFSVHMKYCSASCECDCSLIHKAIMNKVSR